MILIVVAVGGLTYGIRRRRRHDIAVESNAGRAVAVRSVASVTRRRDDVATEQRLTHHSRWGWQVFVWLLVVAVGLLAFEVLKQNHTPHEQLHDRPWNVHLLGVGPTATLVGAALGWIVARDQYGRSSQPVLRPVSRWVAPSGRLGAPAEQHRQVDLKNTGTGIAFIKSVRWRIQVRDADDPVEKSSMTNMLGYLKAHGFEDTRDFVLSNYSRGTSLEPGEERVYFECTDDMVQRLRMLDAVFEFESSLRDVFERSVPLLPSPGATAALTAAAD